MLWFTLCTVLLGIGYLAYGSLVDKIFGIQPERPTPAITLRDNVDYVPLATTKVWLVQLLNIAGIGPIFGPIMGALYGPIALLWIVFGSIFAGAVHDYFSGFLSLRSDGASIPTIVGSQLGRTARFAMEIFALVLLVLVGIIFVQGPALLLNNITLIGLPMWTAIIFAYYILATLIPIDKMIGIFYPACGVLLISMSIALIVGLTASGHGFSASGMSFFTNYHPTKLPWWPLMFITISCGAISGFHATQSPLMARCLRQESSGRSVFYGAMIAEGIIALIWCTLGLNFYDSPESLHRVLESGGPSQVVHEISSSLLGKTGGVLAIISVIILPITSGDTAFRAARLMMAEFFKLPQKKIVNRLAISLPLFLVSYYIMQSDFSSIWSYFGWANQLTAAVVLWASAVYLRRHNRLHWICTVPAMFLTTVCTTYLLNSTIGFECSMRISSIVGLTVSSLCTMLFLLLVHNDSVILLEQQSSRYAK